MELIVRKPCPAWTEENSRSAAVEAIEAATGAALEDEERGAISTGCESGVREPQDSQRMARRQGSTTSSRLTLFGRRPGGRPAAAVEAGGECSVGGDRGADWFGSACGRSCSAHSQTAPAARHSVPTSTAPPRVAMFARLAPLLVRVKAGEVPSVDGPSACPGDGGLAHSLPARPAASMMPEMRSTKARARFGAKGESARASSPTFR